MSAHRKNFISANENLIIHCEYEGQTYIPETQVRAYSLDGAVEHICQSDNAFAAFRCGPEGMEDITEELADAFCAGKPQCDIPVLPWCEERRLECPEFYTNPNAEHRLTASDYGFRGAA